MSVVVQLSKFEGPLALLLYLIRKEEMDIFDIKINEITSQYLDYIKLMKELDLEVAGEFVAMAATLIQIKSKMLLPQYDEKGEIVENEDPRKELVQKLLEYQKYQEAARLLYERPLVGRDMWTRGTRLNLDEPSEEIEIEENGLFAMISLYRQIMRSAKKRIHQVTAKAQSISSRILEIRDMLTMGTRRTLNELVGAGENQVRQILITFLSVLELAKLGFVGLYQTETYGDLWIDLRKPIENDVVSRVEEYESLDSVADKLFSSAAIEQENPLIEDGEDFLLADAEDGVASDVPFVSEADMASDEEILLAEMELENPGSSLSVTPPLELIGEDGFEISEVVENQIPVSLVQENVNVDDDVLEMENPDLLLETSLAVPEAVATADSEIIEEEFSVAFSGLSEAEMSSIEMDFDESLLEMAITEDEVIVDDISISTEYVVEKRDPEPEAQV